MHRESAIRSTAAAAVEELGKFQREQAGKTVLRDGNPAGDRPVESNQPGPTTTNQLDGSPREGEAARSTVGQAGTSGAVSVTPSGAGGSLRMIGGGRGKGKAAGKGSVSTTCPIHPLFKKLFAEGGAPSTRVQSVVVAALR